MLFGIFFDDWRRIASGLLRSLRDREIAPDDVDARLGWLLVVGTIPAGILGLLLEHPLRTLFASAPSAAAFLILNGVLLLAFERLRRRAPGFGEDVARQRRADRAAELAPGDRRRHRRRPPR